MARVRGDGRQKLRAQADSFLQEVGYNFCFAVGGPVAPFPLVNWQGFVKVRFAQEANQERFVLAEMTAARRAHMRTHTAFIHNPAQLISLLAARRADAED